MTGAARQRNRILSLATALLLVLPGAWWLLDHRPRVAEVVVRERALRLQQTRNREARTQMVEMGTPEVEAEIARLRGEAAVAAARVPGAAPETPEMMRVLSEVERRHGVRVHAVEPLPPTPEGRLQVDGLRVQAAGRYHDLGSFLTDVLSLERATQLRSARLDAVPDTLMRRIARTAPAGAPPAFPLAAPPAPGEGPATGAAPFDGVVTFTLHWFSVRPEAAAPAADRAF